MFDFLTGTCAACLRHNVKQKLANRAKALNHWCADGSGKTQSGTVSDCHFSHEVPGLVSWAREQNALKQSAREDKARNHQLQCIRDSTENVFEPTETARDSTMVPPGTLMK